MKSRKTPLGIVVCLLLSLTFTTGALRGDESELVSLIEKLKVKFATINSIQYISERELIFESSPIPANLGDRFISPNATFEGTATYVYCWQGGLFRVDSSIGDESSAFNGKHYTVLDRNASYFSIIPFNASAPQEPFPSALVWAYLWCLPFGTMPNFEQLLSDNIWNHLPSTIVRFQKKDSQSYDFTVDRGDIRYEVELLDSSLGTGPVHWRSYINGSLFEEARIENNDVISNDGKHYFLPVETFVERHCGDSSKGRYKIPVSSYEINHEIPSERFELSPAGVMSIEDHRIPKDAASSPLPRQLLLWIFIFSIMVLVSIKFFSKLGFNRLD